MVFDPASITVLLTTLKAAFDLGNTLADSDSGLPEEEQKTVQNLLANLNSVSIDAAMLTAEYHALLKKNADLEKQVSKLTERIKDLEDYELKEICPGVFVYSLKDGAKPGEPTHWLCPKCRNEDQKSILQRESHTMSGTFYFCPTCQTKILDTSNKRPAPRIDRSSNRYF